jgi:hypothetical protein
VFPCAFSDLIWPSSQLKTSSEIRKGRVGNANGKRSDFHGYARATASDDLSFSNHLLIRCGIQLKSQKSEFKPLASVPPHRLYLPVAY